MCGHCTHAFVCVCAVCVQVHVCPGAITKIPTIPRATEVSTSSGAITRVSTSPWATTRVSTSPGAITKVPSSYLHVITLSLMSFSISSPFCLIQLREYQFEVAWRNTLWEEREGDQPLPSHQPPSTPSFAHCIFSGVEAVRTKSLFQLDQSVMMGR